MGTDGENEEGDAEQHAELRRQVLALKDASSNDAWAMADALIAVHKGGCYHGWGFDTWKAYVEKEVDIHIRKAQQLIKTQEWLELLPKNVAAWIRKLNWTKARMLCGTITAENAAEWRAKIENSTVMEIDKMLHDKAQAAAADPEGAGEDASNDRQKPYNLGRPSPAQRANLDRAAEVAAQAAGCDTVEDHKAKIWDLIATEYLSVNSSIKTVQDYLANVESVIGLRLIAYDLENQEVAYGGETLDIIANDGDDEDAESEDAAISPQAH